ncbi:MAG: carboxypeptidase regulatory-like domain-containing protein [Granulicella sp.]
MTSRLRKSSLLVLSAAALVALSTVALAAPLTGIVINKTTDKPSAGDVVVLLQLSQGMQEIARTKTDAHGNFTLNAPDNGIHLVRVTHDKADYFRQAPPGTQSVEVEVYNSAPHVNGVTGEALVMRIQSDPGGGGLRVIENFFVKNDSKPLMTQFSDRSFEFYLPAGAVVEGSAALRPGGMPVQTAPVPLKDAPNHYAFVFPLSPGETRFQITYKLAYTGSFKFEPRLVLPTDTVALMMPKSMKFEAGKSASYSPVTEELNAQTYVARNVVPSQPMDFTVSGEGQLPRDPAPGTGAAAAGGAASDATQSAPNAAAADTRPGGGLGIPIDPEGANDPWSKYKWWILGGLGLALSAGAGFMMKGSGNESTATAAVPPTAAPSGPGALLQTLKDELFALETEHLQGKLTDAEYTERKSALETVLRHALARIEAPAVASNPQAPKDIS